MGEQFGRPSDAIETLQFLAGSRVRIRLLSVLRDEQADARTLVDTLDVPHSTVQRNLNKLQERGWVDTTLDRSYYTTPVGQIVLDSLDGLLGTVRSMDGLAEFVDCVPFQRYGFDLECLADADCTVADSETPSAPLNEFVDLLDEAAGFTLLTPHWNPAYKEVVARQLDDADGTAEVITHQSQRSLLTAGSVGALTDLQADDRLTVRLTEDDLSLGLGVVDDRVALAGFRDGSLRVLVVTDDERVRSWAAEFLAGVREESTRLRGQLA